MVSRISKSIITCLSIVSISSCVLLKPYQAELGQGNYIREDLRNQLALGQTPAQVNFLLGTPVLTGEFPKKRWVYPTYSESSGYQKLTIEFENGVVSSISDSSENQ